jgi:predicted restriction endonuclease
MGKITNYFLFKKCDICNQNTQLYQTIGTFNKSVTSFSISGIGERGLRRQGDSRAKKLTCDSIQNKFAKNCQDSMLIIRLMKLGSNFLDIHSVTKRISFSIIQQPLLRSLTIAILSYQKHDCYPI